MQQSDLHAGASQGRAVHVNMYVPWQIMSVPLQGITPHAHFI